MGKAERDECLFQVGRFLKSVDYRFTTLTPHSHSIVLARHESDQQSRKLNTRSYLREFFGWNRRLPLDDLPRSLLPLLSFSELVDVSDNKIRSRLRAATLENLLFFHSEFPTQPKDSIFFGPDSYRFARFIHQNMKPYKKLFDLGCGTGVGGIFFKKMQKQEHPCELYLSDINPLALEIASVNCRVNDVTDVEIFESDMFSNMPNKVDLVIANPPFIIDPSKRTYRDGGEHYGAGFSLKLVKDFLKCVQAPATLLLYTGASVVEGCDVLLEQLTRELSDREVKWSYSELDPDIFGDQLSLDEYKDVERIAAVGLHLEKP